MKGRHERCLGSPRREVGTPTRRARTGVDQIDILFTDADVKDYRGAAESNSANLKVFNEQVLLGGLLKGDNKFYVSTAHTTEDIDEALAICDIALAAVAKE